MKSMKYWVFAIVAALVFSANLWSEDASRKEDTSVKKPFLILKSTKNHLEAMNFAKEAATKLKLKLDLRDLSENPESGLTFPKEVCEGEGWEFPCYVARGRFDDGSFISIEHSSAYQGFAEGYYIVIAAGGKEESAKTLKTAKKFYPDAYIKSTEVYIGCMH